MPTVASILVLEQVSPGATLTVRSNEGTPRTVPPDIELADGGIAANRLLSRVPIADIDKTVLVKDAQAPAHE
jgi:hypothetical protein